MKKIINSIFLISCTSIGAGILALPCLTAYNGFLYSSITFILCYFFMTISSLSILEASLWFKKNTNIISIINQILGYKWKIIVSIIYISLLYSLISAYIIAYKQWITNEKILHLSNIISSLFYIIIAVLIVFYKNKIINRINSILSLSLFIVYIIIIWICIKQINIENIKINELNKISNIITLAITSFGFGIIIPTLLIYLKKDYKKLYVSTIIGSLIPLIIYITWIFSIIGIFPINSEYSLEKIHENKINADIIFINFIEKIVHSGFISFFLKIFSILAILTSLIGVLASLKDFFSDERLLKKNDLITLFLMVLPITTLTYTNIGFVSILKISGILVSVLLGLIPIKIIWYGRYILKISGKRIIPGGRFLLLLTYIFFSYAIINDLILLIK